MCLTALTFAFVCGSGLIQSLKEGKVMKRKFVCLLLTVSTAAALLAGCGTTGTGSSTPAASSDAASGTAAAGTSEAAAASSGDGTTMTFAVAGECETLDPGLTNYLASSAMIMNLFSGLEQTGSDGTSIVPGCAESYDVSEDGLTYTFHLYNDLKWSDGSTLNANDFVYSWLRVLNPDTASSCASDFFLIKNAEEYNSGKCEASDVGIQAPDDNTLVVTLNTPASYFIDLTASASYCPVKQSVVEGNDTWTQDPSTLISNGAFYIDTIKTEDRYVLKKNPYYKQADSVALDTVNVVFIEDSTAAQTALENGEIDMTNNISQAAESQYAGTDQLLTFDSIGCTYFDVNTENLTDARVRKALSESIDRDTINQNFIANKPESATGFVPHGVSYPDSEDDYRTVVGDLISYNVDDAKSLLNAAVADGFDTSKTYTILVKNSDEQKNVAQALQSMWSQNLGLTFEIKTVESGSYWDEVHAGNFDIAYDGWTGDYDDPSTMLDVCEQGSVETNNRWADDEALKYTDLLKETEKETDQAKRFENFKEAEQILMDESPIIPLNFKNSQVLVSTTVKTAVNDHLGHYMIRYDAMN